MNFAMIKNTAFHSVWSLTLFKIVIICLTMSTANADKVKPTPAPEFDQTTAEKWLNSAPLKLADLRGSVVMIDFWTFECWNCYRSFPWLNALEERLSDESFQVIGVHTPEFEHEKVRENIEA